MRTEDQDRYALLTAGAVLWHSDGRGSRPDNLVYRESFRATYQGPYSVGKELAWDGLIGNRAGMIGNDPARGFDLTMRAGDAQAGSYTTRDLASAGHGIDYKPHYAERERDATAHPNLLLPGRTALWKGVRFDALALGDDVLGTGGCCVQNWSGIDFDTMERYGNVARSDYSGGGFVFFKRTALLPRAARMIRPFVKPFGTPRPGVAPLYAMFARVKGYMLARVVHVDPDVPHELAIHWTPDARAIELWLDGAQVLRVRQGAFAVPAGLRTNGRVRFQRCALHMDCWQDNGAGGFDVIGDAGHPDRDQTYTVESLSILG
jgi:hypothetical protein